SFGLHFTFRSLASDLEHQHLTEPVRGRSRQTVPAPRGAVLATTAVTVQPVSREFLFDATLTLYLPVGMADAFRAPAYPVVLGRSQDLAEVVSVDVVTLRRSDRIRLEHTLLPWRLRPCIPAGPTVLLSRYIGEPPRRETQFDRYIALHDAVFVGGDAGNPRAVLRVE